MADDPPPPSLLWRAGSTAIMGITGSLTRAFMHVANWQDAHGLNGFLELLDKRANVDGRQRGLITGMSTYTHQRGHESDQRFPVSNHISVYVRSLKSKYHSITRPLAYSATLQH